MLDVFPNLGKNFTPAKYRYKVNGKKYRTLQKIADAEGLEREHIRQKKNDLEYPSYRRLFPSGCSHGAWVSTGSQCSAKKEKAVGTSNPDAFPNKLGFFPG